MNWNDRNWTCDTCELGRLEVGEAAPGGEEEWHLEVGTGGVMRSHVRASFQAFRPTCCMRFLR